MATYMEANQVVLGLKMKLSFYSWYNSCTISQKDADYYVIVHIKRINNQIRKLIPQVINGISVRTELE